MTLTHNAYLNLVTHLVTVSPSTSTAVSSLSKIERHPHGENYPLGKWMNRCISFSQWKNLFCPPEVVSSLFSFKLKCLAKGNIEARFLDSLLTHNQWGKVSTLLCFQPIFPEVLRKTHGREHGKEKATDILD